MKSSQISKRSNKDHSMPAWNVFIYFLSGHLFDDDDPECCLLPGQEGHEVVQQDVQVARAPPEGDDDGRDVAWRARGLHVAAAMLQQGRQVPHQLRVRHVVQLQRHLGVWSTFVLMFMQIQEGAVVSWYSIWVHEFFFIGIVRVGKYRVVCLCVCLCVCLSVCACVCSR